MPYIKQAERGGFVEVKRVPATTGQLNYLLTTICIAYLRQRGEIEGQVVISYGGINDVIGALECAKLELYRRQAAGYEDKKAIDNGDLNWIR